MSNLERDLRDLLAARAGDADPLPGDWQDLTVRMARRNQRSKRVLATGLVAALLVGPLAGFGVAQAIEDTTATGRVSAAAPDGADAGPGAVVARDRLAAGAEGQLFLDGPGQHLEKLFRRTTDDGIVVRAFISRFQSSDHCDGYGWCPPPECFPTASVTGELSTDAAVGFAHGPQLGGEAPAVRLTGAGVFGANGEGAPARWVVAQAGSDVERVRVEFEGGGRDEMAPVDGVVLLAALADATKAGGTIAAIDGSGAVLEEADLASMPAGAVIASDALRAAPVGSTTPTTLEPGPAPPLPSDTSWLRAAAEGCLPPAPSLPEPGEQPGDPAAARAEIERAFALAYAGGLGDDEAKRAVVQDSEALTGVMEEIRNGAFAQQVKDASAHVSEIVFTSPTEAGVRYDINVKDSSSFPGRIGKALLIDGRWKVARVTVCADIGLAGATCPSE